MKSAAIRAILLFIGLPVAVALSFGASLIPLLAAYAAYILLMLWSARQSGRKGAVKRVDWSAVAFMLFLYFGLPVALASVVSETWREILIAYSVWFGLLGLWMLHRAASAIARRPAGRSSPGCS